MTEVRTEPKMFRMDLLTERAELVATTVRAQIEASGVTVVWLCERTGIPRSTMIRRLNGHTSFTVAELERIAQVLRVPVDQLLAVSA